MGRRAARGAVQSRIPRLNNPVGLLAVAYRQKSAPRPIPLPLMPKFVPARQRATARAVGLA